MSALLPKADIAHGVPIADICFYLVSELMLF